jgi:hypothetical protein
MAAARALVDEERGETLRTKIFPVDVIGVR